MSDETPALFKSAIEKLKSEGILEHADFRNVMNAALRSAFPNSPLFDGSQVPLQSGGNTGIQNPVPSQPVSANLPLSANGEKPPMIEKGPGISGVTAPHTENRTSTPQGFQSRDGSPEPNTGALSLGAQSRPNAKGISGENTSAGYVAPGIDRTSSLTKPGQQKRAFKAAPTTGVHLPQGG